MINLKTISSKLIVSTFMILAMITLSNCKKGCTDSEATNYSSKNKRDDGSCRYQSELLSFEYSVLSCGAPFTIEIEALFKTFEKVPDMIQTVTVYVDGSKQIVEDLDDSGYLNSFLLVNSAGNHEIKFEISNEDGSFEYIKNISLNSQYSPVASFSYSGSNYNCMNFGKVDFTNNSIYASAFTWDFGDGTTSSLKEGTHYYSAPGIYQVSLTAQCIGAGAASDVISTTITVSNTSASAQFSMQAVNNNYHSPSNVTFTSNYYSGASYAWYIDNNYVGNDYWLNYTFTNTGQRSVRLEVTCGGSTISSTSSVQIDAAYTHVNVTKVRFWYPSGYYNNLYYEHYLDGNFDNASALYGVGSNYTYAEWTGPSIQYFNSVGLSRYNISDFDGSNNTLLKYYYFSPDQLKDDYYPTVLNWNGSGGFDFQLLLSYY